jgi:iron complex transport system ATP-binding protein
MTTALSISNHGVWTVALSLSADGVWTVALSLSVDGVWTVALSLSVDGVGTVALSLSVDGVGTAALSLSVPRSGPPRPNSQPRPRNPNQQPVRTTAPSLSVPRSGRPPPHSPSPYHPPANVARPRLAFTAHARHTRSGRALSPRGRPGNRRTMLSATNVTFSFDRTPVVHDVSLAVHQGDMLALAGPNGSGKTTLLRLLSGVLRPESGQVSINGADLSTLSQRLKARSIAVVPQHLEQHLGFAVGDVVQMGRSAYASIFRPAGPADQTAVERAMETTGVDVLARREFSELSGGEQQRVMLAMALAQETDYLLLDEPTVHLDLHHQRELLEMLLRLRSERQIGVLAVMHDLNLSALYFDRMAVMHGGSLIADGTPAEIMSADDHLAIFSTHLLRLLHPQTGVPQVVLQRGEDEQR